MPKKTFKLKNSQINQIAKFFSISQAPLKSMIVILGLGISLGVFYEEMVGVGTWHQFNQEPAKINLCFTPEAKCGSLIAQELVKASKSIHVQAYGLTMHSIIYQLKQAHKRGVNVNILLDGGNLSDNQEIFNEFKKQNINVAFDKMPGIAHNKVIIIDGKKLFTGSFNFTNAADTRNAENLLLIQDVKIAKEYLRNWYSRYNANIKN